MICVKCMAFCDLWADFRIRLATLCKSVRKFWFCNLALTCVDLWVRLARALHMCFHLMWIESVLGNLILSCSVIETSDTELSGIHWSRKVPYLKSRVSHWIGEKQRRCKDTTQRARTIVLLHNQPINQFEPSYVTSAPLFSSTHPSK